VPNNSYDRYNFTFRNTTSFLNDKMRLDVGASYVLQEDCNMINQGTYNNPLTGAYLFPRGDDWADIEMYERYDPIDKISKQYWPMGDGSITMQNPYWANYRNLRENRKDRYMLNAALSYDILDWLNVSGRIRLDNSHNTYTEKMDASWNVQLTEQSANGLYGVTKTMDRQVYGDALLNINKTFGDDWSLQANIGASFSDMKNDALKIRGPIADGTSGEKQGLANVFNIQNLSNSTKTVRKQEGWREQTQSIFASAEVGYKGTYYLTLTGRNDWPSQLAGPHSNAKSFFYPSVGLSVVLSQLIPNMPENLSYIKLRGSFASVGVAFERYIANPLYSWNESGLSWNTQTQYPAYHLKPERTKSFEVGLTMRFLKHFNLDFTYYNSHTSNQTFDPQISGGTGFSKIIIQSGNVRNQGIELALGYRNTWRDFTWDTNYTLSTNQNKIVSLANNVINYATGERFSIDRLNMGGLGDALFLLQEGGTLGDLYSRRDLRYDENNAIYIDENGNVATETIQDVKKYVKLGSVLPDANMSWRNDFRWKNLNFDDPHLRFYGCGPFGRHRLFAYAGYARPVRRVRGYGRGARCRRCDAQRRRRGGCLHLVFGHRGRQFHPAVLHLFGYERALAGGFNRLHDSPRSAAQRLRDHGFDRGPQLVDGLQQGSVRSGKHRDDGQLLSRYRLLHDAVIAQRGIQSPFQILKQRHDERQNDKSGALLRSLVRVGRMHQELPRHQQQSL